MTLQSERRALSCRKYRSMSDLDRSRELVDRVCAALVLASPDREHPASRYGQMLRLLSKKLEELSEQSVSAAADVRSR